MQPGVDWQITFVPQGGDPFVKAQTKNTDQSGGAVFTGNAWEVGGVGRR